MGVVSVLAAVLFLALADTVVDSNVVALEDALAAELLAFAGAAVCCCYLGITLCLLSLVLLAFFDIVGDGGVSALGGETDALAAELPELADAAADSIGPSTLRTPLLTPLLTKFTCTPGIDNS
ncbi:hypothetical protein FACS189449_12820 [Alphaproteobacteria bacterium]|nr:hypothetical protein FACS189449_12820 [Alphaproteobacteria bacterium]